ncbi:MAG TPA: VanZ family protein [Flavisolibacter sp.]|jgi:VanZ family protein
MLRITAKQAKTAALVWLVFISVLFFLPGSALPKQGWLDGIHFDKWVHFGFFGLLLFLWRFYWPAKTGYHVLLLVMAFLYGLGVELIQHYYVANRSFDSGDLIADMVGAVAGILFWEWYKKNRPL